MCRFLSRCPAATQRGTVLTDVNNKLTECRHCGVNCKCLTHHGQWTKGKCTRRYSRSNGIRKAARHLSDPDSAVREPRISFFVTRHQIPDMKCWPKTTAQNFISEKPHITLDDLFHSWLENVNLSLPPCYLI